MGHGIRSVVALFTVLTALISCNASDSSFKEASSIAGQWESGGSTYQVTTDGVHVKAVFEDVSVEASALGFKKGDLSFEGDRNQNFIQGEQVIRYATTHPCYKQGRRVPLMALVGGDGQQIVIDWYNMSISTETCQDMSRVLGMTVLKRRGS